MSGLSDFLTEGSFWWGAGAGAVIAGTVGPLITMRSLRKSDERKAAHEASIQTRKEEHEDDLDQKKADREQEKRNQEIIFEASTTFAAACSDILVNSIDVKGVFNFLRDEYHNGQGTPDPKAAEKFAFAEAQVDQTKQLMTPFNKLKMIAPVDLLAQATRLNVAVLALGKTITEPFARVVALKAAGDELDGFINAFRKEYGREQYPPSDAQRDAMSFMSTLKKQVDDFQEEAEKDMRAAGFTSTPWGNA